MQTTSSALLSVILLFSIGWLQAQNTILGTVTDTDGEAIPFASIYVKDGYKGTSSNNEGNFYLELGKPGEYQIVFQSLGYETVTKSISLQGKPVTINATLAARTDELDEVVITNGEDPAYEIIRQAIAAREENLMATRNFTADFYSRGLAKLEDTPEKILGQEVGDMDGALDSISRSGIVYLSETVSKIYRRAPDDFKEIISASKVSGDEFGYSANSAEGAYYNFYENSIEFENKLVSPIADDALGYYDYKLVSTFYDDNNKLINKIQVKPKRPKDNTFSGFIYIVENDWSIYGIDLTASGSNLGIEVIDELRLKQDFSYDQNRKQWEKRNQTIDFLVGIFGFTASGRFTAVYSNYNFDPEFSEDLFDAAIFIMQEDANKKDSLFWKEQRQVPLSVEESKDYRRRDSIAEVRGSKAYQDSVDQKRNRFRLLDAITGYTYRNSYKNFRTSYSGLLRIPSFNTVTGYLVDAELNLVKGFDQDYNKRLSINTNFNYAVSEDRFRYHANASYRFNRKSYRRLSVFGGTRIRQINDVEAISDTENSLSSLLAERNYAKFYEQDYAGIRFSEQFFNGLYFSAEASYQQRENLFNTTDQTWFDWEDQSYTSNNPLSPQVPESRSFLNHEITKVRTILTWRPGQKYYEYPDRRFSVSSEKYPTIRLSYQAGLGASVDGYDYHQLEAFIWQTIDTGRLGDFSFYANGGMFMNADDIAFLDYNHFRGNRLRVKLEALNLYRFGLLDYFNYSTNENFAQIHIEQDFGGLILGRFPLINRLNYDLNVGAKALYTVRNPYFEVHAGIDNIGIGKIRPFKLDYVHSITSDRSFGSFLLGVDVGNIF